MRFWKQHGVRVVVVALILALTGMTVWHLAERSQRPGAAVWVASHQDFRFGLKKMEILGCLRTNHVVSLDLGWWTIQQMNQGGVLPGMAAP